MVLQRTGEVVTSHMTVAQHDDYPDDGAALLVGRGDHRGLGDGGVGDQGRLDLERADAVAG